LRGCCVAESDLSSAPPTALFSRASELMNWARPRGCWQSVRPELNARLIIVPPANRDGARYAFPKDQKLELKRQIGRAFDPHPCACARHVADDHIQHRKTSVENGFGALQRPMPGISSAVRFWCCWFHRGHPRARLMVKMERMSPGRLVRDRHGEEQSEEAIQGSAATGPGRQGLVSGPWTASLRSQMTAYLLVGHHGPGSICWNSFNIPFNLNPCV
jgi:hypothetical protein